MFLICYGKSLFALISSPSLALSGAICVRLLQAAAPALHTDQHGREWTAGTQTAPAAPRLAAEEPLQLPRTRMSSPPRSLTAPPFAENLCPTRSSTVDLLRSHTTSQLFYSYENDCRDSPNLLEQKLCCLYLLVRVCLFFCFFFKCDLFVEFQSV